MTDRLLADLVVALHLLFIAYALLGGLLAAWRPWLAALHLPAAAWVCLLEFNQWACPLTPLENQLRLRAGQQGYSGGFVEHYLIPVLYPAGLTPRTQWLLGAAALALNVLVYALVVGRWWRRRGH